ncbi:MAG: LysR substrate-binding domain-containing protein [Mycetocola sp.]
MEIRQLQVFIAVAEELNFTRAAARLFTTQPSLSRSVQELERELGVQLFDRSTVPLTLTRSGSTLLPDARRICETVDRAIERVRLTGVPPDPGLTVGFVPHLHFHLLPEVMRRYRLTVPDIDITLHMMSSADLEAGLADRSVDVGFCGSATSTGERLGRYSVVAAIPGGHPLGKRRTLSLADFHDEPLVTLVSDRYPSARDWILGLWARSGGQPAVVQVVNSFEEALGLVAAGIGSVLIPEHAALNVDSSRIILRPFDEPLGFDLRMSSSADRDDEHVRRFLDIVREVVLEGETQDFFEPDPHLLTTRGSTTDSGIGATG